MHSRRLVTLFRIGFIAALAGTLWFDGVLAHPVTAPSSPHQPFAASSRNGPPPAPTESPMTCTPPVPYACQVQTAPKILIDFWGFNKEGADPDNEMQYIANFVSAIGTAKDTNNWLSTITQYCNGATPPVCVALPPAVQTKIDATNAVPATVTQADAQAEAVYAASKNFFNDPGDPNANIIVALPTGHKLEPHYCSYHTTDGQSTVYTAFTYATDELSEKQRKDKDRGALCGSFFNGALLDGVSIVIGHEIAEAMSDPQFSSGGAPLGWVNGAGIGQNEVGDVCAWKNIKALAFNGTNYAVQPIFSNKILKCSQSGPNGPLGSPTVRWNGYTRRAAWLTMYPSAMRARVPTVGLPQLARFARPSAPRWSALRRLRRNGKTVSFVAYLYGCDYYDSGCNVYYGSGASAGFIGGLTDPQGTAVDQDYNVYIANTGTNQIFIYAPGGTNQLSTLNDPNYYPGDVAVFQKSGKKSIVAVSNVISTGSLPPNVSVYASTVNEAMPTYYLSDPAAVRGEGVAFDSSGNCYWSFVNTSGVGQIDEFPGCAKHVSPTNLMISTEYAGGLAFDSNDNLYYTDQLAGTVNACLSTTPATCSVLASGFGDPLFMAWDGNAVMELADAMSGLYQFNLYGDVNELTGAQEVGVSVGAFANIP
jgi:hypothetical protein